MSAAIVPFMGRAYDRWKLTHITAFAAIGLAMGCLILANTTSAFLLIAGMFLIRLFGQGTLNLISVTTMAKHFVVSRGKALSCSGLGISTAEVILPLFVAWVMAAIGWRGAWTTLSAVVFFFFLPVSLLMILRLTKNPESEIRSVEDTSNIQKLKDRLPEISWTSSQVLKDRKFWVLSVYGLIPACFLTALFFHQGKILESRGVDLIWMAKGLAAFGLFRGVMSLVAGPVTDKFSAKAMYPFVLFPFVAGLFIFGFVMSPYGFVAYCALSGLSVAFTANTRSSLWPELYGVEHLGSLKGILTGLGVFSTALGPPVLGYLLDIQFPLELVFGAAGVVTVIMGFAVQWVLAKTKKAVAQHIPIEISLPSLEKEESEKEVEALKRRPPEQSA